VSNLKAFAALGFGYLLVFAALYKAGAYALRPWLALKER
jgi:hypothetical protein